jgi:hypothetical protein
MPIGWKQRQAGKEDGGDGYFDIDNDGISFNPNTNLLQFTDVNTEFLFGDNPTTPFNSLISFSGYDGNYSGSNGLPITGGLGMAIYNVFAFAGDGAAASVYGEYAVTYVRGDINGGDVNGLYLQANNRGASNTDNIYGIYANAHAEATASGEAVGITGVGLKGNLNATPLIVGIRGVTAGHFNGTDTAIAGDFEAQKQVSGAESIDKSISIRARHLITLGTVDEAYGLSLSGWSNSATVNTSYGIYADTSIDIGTTKYFIYSLSTSPSYLSGRMFIEAPAHYISASLASSRLQLGDTTPVSRSGTVVDYTLVALNYVTNAVNNYSTQGIETIAAYSGTGTTPNVKGLYAGATISTASVPKAGSVQALDVSALVSTSTNGAATIRGLNLQAGAGTNGGTVDNMEAIKAHMYSNNGTTVTAASFFKTTAGFAGSGSFGSVRGLDLTGWSTIPVTNSYGIYADTSIDRGSTLKYFIYSLSTSPSLFSGEVQVPDEAFASGWNGDLSVPTKNAVFDELTRNDSNVKTSAEVFTNNGTTWVGLFSSIATKTSEPITVHGMVKFSRSAGTDVFEFDFDDGTATFSSFWVEVVFYSAAGAYNSTQIVTSITTVITSPIADGYFTFNGAGIPSNDGVSWGIRARQNLGLAATNTVEALSYVDLHRKIA